MAIKEFSCAEECKKYFSSYIDGNQYSDTNDFDIGLSDTNEPLPIDMNQIVFSTEGHVFLLWSSLCPSRLPKYEKAASRDHKVIKTLHYQVVHPRIAFTAAVLVQKRA